MNLTNLKKRIFNAIDGQNHEVEMNWKIISIWENGFEWIVFWSVARSSLYILAETLLLIPFFLHGRMLFNNLVLLFFIFLNARFSCVYFFCYYINLLLFFFSSWSQMMGCFSIIQLIQKKPNQDNFTFIIFFVFWFFI